MNTFKSIIKRSTLRSSQKDFPDSTSVSRTLVVWKYFTWDCYRKIKGKIYIDLLYCCLRPHEIMNFFFIWEHNCKDNWWNRNNNRFVTMGGKTVKLSPSDLVFTFSKAIFTHWSNSSICDKQWRIYICIVIYVFCYDNITIFIDIHLSFSWVILLYIQYKLYVRMNS